MSLCCAGRFADSETAPDCAQYPKLDGPEVVVLDRRARGFVFSGCPTCKACCLPGCVIGLIGRPLRRLYLILISCRLESAATECGEGLSNRSCAFRGCSMANSRWAICQWRWRPRPGAQGADTPVPAPVPVPVPGLSGDGDGASVPDLPGGGDAPPSPSPICPESGVTRGLPPVPVPDLLKSGTRL
jgi:hypothetical protein